MTATIVQRAVNAQATDIAARKKQGRHDMRIGRHDEPPGWRRQTRPVVALRKECVVEMARKDFTDQLHHRPASRTVREVHRAMLQIQRTHIPRLHRTHRCLASLHILVNTLSGRRHIVRRGSALGGKQHACPRL